MISRSLMYLGGLKKWAPRKRSWKSWGRPSHICRMEIPEVLELMTAPSRRKGISFFQQIPLGVKIFDDGFDHPIRPGNPGEMVFKISNPDQVGILFRVERGGVRFLDPFLSHRGKAIPHLRTFCSQSLLFLCFGQFFWDDVEKKRRNSHIGEVSGDGAPHGSCAQHRCLLDPLVHGSPFLRGSLAGCDRFTKCAELHLINGPPLLSNLPNVRKGTSPSQAVSGGSCRTQE